MQSQFIKDLQNEAIAIPDTIISPEAVFLEADSIVIETETVSSIEPACFQSQFIDCMEMYADAQTVRNYLDAHHEWFRRCAQPMVVDLISENGYAITIGRFGSFGYEVEPKVGLELLPQNEDVYRIKTIPVPNYVAPGYEVDFKAAMHLVEVTVDNRDKRSQLPSIITRVEWQLDLAVYIQFPKFIYRLPKSVIQSTGDRVLCQIVKQVSRRLTQKVQEDFHSSLGIPFGKISRKKVK